MTVQTIIAPEKTSGPGLTVYRPGARVVLTQGARGWPVLVTQVLLRPGGYVAYEVAWLTDQGTRLSQWVEADELGHTDEADSDRVGWFHAVEGTGSCRLGVVG